VNPLVAYDVLAVIGVLICVAILHDRPSAPTPRIVVTPPTVDVPTVPYPSWLDEPDPTFVPATHRPPRSVNEHTGTTWPDPPPPVFARQARPALTASVAAAWDQWHHRTTWQATIPVVLPPVDPDPIQVAA
jgi:hypothetical protein